MSENVIELNGKRYDAVSGKYLGKSRTSAVPAALHMPQNGKVLDGFIRPTAHNLEPHAPQVVHPSLPQQAVTTPVKFKHMDMRNTPKRRPHTPAQHAKAHQPAHASTLMRNTVRKPEVTLKQAIKPHAPAEVMAKPASQLARKRTVGQVDEKRLARASAASKHQAVKRFHTPQGTRKVIVPTVQPVHHPTVPIIAVQSAPVHKQQATHTEMFERAIREATSHTQPHIKHTKHRQRLINTLAIVGTFVVLGGFIAYLNAPNIELHLASAQAGFHATMPNYRPTGYALTGHIKHAGGTVSMRFTSGDSNYTITQQSSDWNSQTLLDSTLALSNGHQTVLKNGETIYIYGNGTSAAWVDGGVRYDLSGNASLNTDQIVSIAASL